MLMTIIDGGSTKKLVSMKVVDNFHLEYLQHTDAYRVSWLKKGHHVMVTRQCEINFKIGELHNSLLCGVIVIDAFHLLLFQPWKYNHNMVYEGCRKTIKIVKDDKSFQLNPLAK